jgi:tetratricopeptide (TPR) repeat protein
MNSRVQQLLKENQNQVNEAEELLLKAMKTLEDDVGTAHSAYAIVLDSLGKIKHLQQKYAEAHEIFQRALSIKEHTVSEQHFTYAISLDHSATNLSCLSGTHVNACQTVTDK